MIGYNQTTPKLCDFRILAIKLGLNDDIQCVQQPCVAVLTKIPSKNIDLKACEPEVQKCCLILVF